MRTWIKDGTIVNEGKQFIGSILIEDDCIKEIHAGNNVSIPNEDTVIDAQGKYIFPGVIDEHVHFRDPGLTYKADMHSESRAAVAGGITSVMDMPNTKPQTTTIEALENKFEEASCKCLTNYSFYFGATNDNYPLFSQLDKHRVCGIKLFMGSSTGNMLVDKKESLLHIFKEANILIAVHCEDQDIISRHIKTYTEQGLTDVPIEKHPEIRDEEACYQSSKLAVELAQEAHARLHILHISTAKELSLFENKPLENKQITAEVCVSHLLFSAKDYARYGSRIKCNPAIKSLHDREALRQAVKDGIIDTIATDHAPHLLTEKEGGALKATSGMPMIQFSLPVMLSLVQEGIFPIETVIEKMCHAPAKLYGIDKRGFIRKGYYADIVIASPHTWTVKKDCIESKCQWSPLEETTLSWKINQTIINGKVVYNEGNIIDTTFGKELRFK